jgi:hypothetical protein
MLVGSTEVEQSGPINKIAENAMQLNSLKINADTTIQKDSTPFLDAQISANLTMDQGFSNIKCDGNNRPITRSIYNHLT